MLCLERVETRILILALARGAADDETSHIIFWLAGVVLYIIIHALYAAVPLYFCYCSLRQELSRAWNKPAGGIVLSERDGLLTQTSLSPMRNLWNFLRVNGIWRCFNDSKRKWRQIFAPFVLLCVKTFVNALIPSEKWMHSGVPNLSLLQALYRSCWHVRPQIFYVYQPILLEIRGDTLLALCSSLKSLIP